MEKIDSALQKTIMQTGVTKTHICLVYVNNLEYAKKYFYKNQVKICREYKFLNLIAVELSSSDVFLFAKQSFVDYIAESSQVLALTNVAREIIGIENLLGAGNNIGVAIVDTGISNHFDFVIGKNRIKKFVDFVNQKKYAYDDNGHGTFVSGVLAGSGFMSAGKFKGFAPEVDLISLKSLDQNGEANAIKILDAFEWIYKKS